MALIDEKKIFAALRPDTKAAPGQWRNTFVTISCLSCLLKSFQGNPVQIVVIKL